MRKELENELKPLNIVDPEYWNKATHQLFQNPNKVLPVFISLDSQYVGDYFLKLIREGNKMFFQAEGFSSNEIESGFVLGSGTDWKKVQPGIYRLDITLNLQQTQNTVI